MRRNSANSPGDGRPGIPVDSLEDDLDSMSRPAGLVKRVESSSDSESDDAPVRPPRVPRAPAARVQRSSHTAACVDELVDRVQSLEVVDGDAFRERKEGGGGGRKPGGEEAQERARSDASSRCAGAEGSGERAPSPRDAGDAGPEGAAVGLELGEGRFRLPRPVYEGLFAHQVEGVTWLWGLYDQGRGGILADDMGLGKTMQVCAFLRGLQASGLATRSLVVAPVSLTAHWAAELGKCGLGDHVHLFCEGSRADKLRGLRACLSRGGVLVTTYGMVLHHRDALALDAAAATALCGEGPWSASLGHGARWDCVVLDEGHKIKNPKTKLAQAARAIASRVRLVISGTPVQNHLGEMWALFDWALPSLLGDAKFFKNYFERAITAGVDREADVHVRMRGQLVAQELRARIASYFLRREKAEVLLTRDKTAEWRLEKGGPGGERSGALSEGKQSADEAREDARATSAEHSEAGSASSGPGQQLGRKNDLIVWLRLSATQRHVYEAFLNSASVHAALNQANSPLAALTVLKKICDHPALLSQNMTREVIEGAARKLGRKGRGTRHASDRDTDESSDKDDEESDVGSAGSDGEGRGTPVGRAAGAVLGAPPTPGLVAGGSMDVGWWEEAARTSGGVEALLSRELSSQGVGASPKTTFCLDLIRELSGQGHRTLVFSQSKVMLDIVQAALSAEPITFLRIDGDVASGAQRQSLVERFQTDPAIPVMLLTSGVGGLGLTLTAADRVVILDPSWNPSTDNQAVDRAFRIGQTRDVVVYRLITCGTVEEKIYRKQVFKHGLSRSTTGEEDVVRYFSSQDLRQLFMVSAAGLEVSETQRQLSRMHAHQRVATEEVQAHIRRLESLPSVAGISDHDLLFRNDAADSAQGAAGDVGKQRAAARAAWGKQRGGPLARIAASATTAAGPSGPGPSGLLADVRLGPAPWHPVDRAALQAIPVGGEALQKAGDGRGTAGSLDMTPLAQSLAEVETESSSRQARAAAHELRDKQRRLERMLAEMAERMPDGGQKLREQLEDTRRKLAALGASAEEPQRASLAQRPDDTNLLSKLDKYRRIVESRDFAARYSAEEQRKIRERYDQYAAAVGHN